MITLLHDLIAYVVSDPIFAENTTAITSSAQGAVTPENRLLTTSITNTPTLLSDAVPTVSTVTKNVTDIDDESAPRPTPQPDISKIFYLFCFQMLWFAFVSMHMICKCEAAVKISIKF